MEKLSVGNIKKVIVESFNNLKLLDIFKILRRYCSVFDIKI